MLPAIAFNAKFHSCGGSYHAGYHARTNTTPL